MRKWLPFTVPLIALGVIVALNYWLNPPKPDNFRVGFLPVT
ncbi:MAG: hypothetical protein WD468_08570 [Pirellulales bacterium]